MIGFFALVVIATLGGSLLTRMSPTVDEIKTRFELAQTYYAAKDYDNGVTLFSGIADTPNRAILNVDTVTVAIDELVLPVRIAARYQVGNSLRNVGLDLLARSESARADGDTAMARMRRLEAVEALRQARQHFTAIVQDEKAPETVRVMSQYQVIRAAFAQEDYEAVVGDVERLLALFPGNSYEEAALYDLGWAYFRMAEPAKSIETFQRVLRLSQDAVRIDRALFQIGEAYFGLDNLREARAWYQRLVGKYDFSALSEKDLLAMQTAKLRGVVQETTRELVAKAQIKIGDTYARVQEVDAAIAAYALVPERYPQEQDLVEQSYTRLAALVLEARGLDAGIRQYEQAILRSERQEFQATTQLQIARLLYAAGRYERAADAYGVYWLGYSEVARIVGFTRDKVLFKLGECHRQLGIELAAAAPAKAREALARALAEYDSTLACEGTALVADAIFGRGAALLAAGQPDAAQVEFERVGRDYPAHPAAPAALLQIGRLHYAAGRLPESAAAYRRLLREHPGTNLGDEAHMELGVVYKGLGQTDAALAEYQQVSRSSPNWVKVQVEIGDLLTAAGRYDVAQERLSEALGEAAGDLEAKAALLYLQGRIAHSRKHYGEAVAALSEALSISPGEQVAAGARFLRALSAYQLGKLSDAAGDSAAGGEYYGRVLSDLELVLRGAITPKMRNVAYRTLGAAATRLGRADQTTRYYSELISRTEDAQERASFLLLLMELHYDQRHFEESASAARWLIAERFADNDEMGYYLKERAYSVLASSELERQQHGAALAAAAKGLEEYPSSGESASMAFAIGLSQYYLKDYPAAAASFDRYAERFPADARVLEGMYYAGQCWQILGKFQVAAERFLRVARTFPRSATVPEALFLAGENLFNGYQFGKALETYNRVLEEFPAGEYADDAAYSSAWALFELERMEEGVARMKLLAQRYPDSAHAPRALFSVGDYYYTIHDYEKAQDAYAALVAKFPNSAEAPRARELVTELDEEISGQLYEAAVARHLADDFKGAVAGFARIAAEYPRTATALAALNNMGVALEKLGEKGRAKAAYQEVITRAEADPEHQGAVVFAKARLAHL